LLVNTNHLNIQTIYTTLVVCTLIFGGKMRHTPHLSVSLFNISWMALLTISCSEYSLDEKINDNLGNDTSAVDDVVTDTSVPTDTDTTDTPDEPVDENAPVAVCSVRPNPVTPPFEAATFDGSASYDPSGNPLSSYYWELIDIPEGSAAYLPFNSALMIPNFYADLAGDYTARLTVTNSQGLSDTCEVTLESLPVQSLWVEMFWQYQDDMDLHLLAPGGSLLSDQDCYYANCTWGGLDWGQLGNTSDDPSLDLDDIPGTGPENINIYTPQSNGVYTVYVHDYSGSTTDTSGPNNVTVNVYLNGSKVWSTTKAISGDGNYVPFCTIDWAAQAVYPL